MERYEIHCNDDAGNLVTLGRATVFALEKIHEDGYREWIDDFQTVHLAKAHARAASPHATITILDDY